jgi:hypothetical protein
MDDADDFKPWTVERREALLDAGDVLAQAVRAHTRAYASAASLEDFPDTFPASDALLAAAKAYAEAQFNYSGNGYPLGILHSIEEEDDPGAPGDGDEGASEGPQDPVTGITILQRIDYAVVDEAAILAAGRAAYRSGTPGALASTAAGEVTTVSQAIHQIADTRGWTALAEIEGLEPIGSTSLVHRQTELLSENPEEWPDDIFAVDGELLYGQREVYLAG